MQVTINLPDTQEGRLELLNKITAYLESKTFIDLIKLVAELEKVKK